MTSGQIGIDVAIFGTAGEKKIIKPTIEMENMMLDRKLLMDHAIYRRAHTFVRARGLSCDLKDVLEKYGGAKKHNRTNKTVLIYT